MSLFSLESRFSPPIQAEFRNALTFGHHVRNTLTNALDLSEDEIRIRSPDEGFGVVIALVQVFEHGFFQCSHGGMASTTDASAGHFGKESLDQVEPTGAGGGKVNVIARVAR